MRALYFAPLGAMALALAAPAFAQDGDAVDWSGP